MRGKRSSRLICQSPVETHSVPTDTSSLETLIKMGDISSQIIAYPIYGIYTTVEIGLRMVILAILLKTSYEFIMLSYYFINGGMFSKEITFEEYILEEKALLENHVSTQTLYEENEALKNIIEEMKKSKAKMNEQLQECNYKNENLKSNLYDMENYVILLITFITITSVHIVKVKIEKFIRKKLKEGEEPSPEPAPSPEPDVVMGEIVEE